jgi:hypothetical protein
MKLLADRRFQLILLLLGLAVWGLVDVRRRGRIEIDDPTAHRTDLTVYTEAGGALREGRDPYAVTNPRSWYYMYPPLFAMVVSPLYGLPSQWQVVIWYAVSVALAFACLGESRRLLALLRAEPLRASADLVGDESCRRLIGLGAFLALLFPLLNCLQRGQVGVLVLYPLLLGLRLTLWGGAPVTRLLGGVALAGPVAVKLTPALPVLFLLGLCWLASRAGAARPRRLSAGAPALGVGLGLALFLFILPSFVSGWKTNLQHLESWMHRIVLNRDLARDIGINERSKRNQSFQNAVHRLAGWIESGRGAEALESTAEAGGGKLEERDLERAIFGARVFFLACLPVAGFFVARRGELLGVCAGFGLATTATLIYSPLSWGHHYLMQLPALLFVPLWLLERGRRRAAAMLAVSAAGLSLGHYLPLDLIENFGLLGIGTALWYLAAAGLSCAPESRRLRPLTSPLPPRSPAGAPRCSPAASPEPPSRQC